MTCTLLLVDDVDTVVTRASPAWLREALDARDRGASADITATDCLCEECCFASCLKQDMKSGAEFLDEIMSLRKRT